VLIAFELRHRYEEEERRAGGAGDACIREHGPQVRAPALHELVGVSLSGYRKVLRYQGKLELRSLRSTGWRSTFKVQATTTRPKVTTTAEGEGVVSHAGSRLLADVADRTTLTAQLSDVLAVVRKLRARHDPGRVLVDMAVAVADGATTISRCRGAGGQQHRRGPHHRPRRRARAAPRPASARHGTPILVRAGTAGCTLEFLAHIRCVRDEEAVSCEFSVGWAITGKERAAISAIPAWVWADAIDAGGGHRDGAGLAEITRVLPARSHRAPSAGSG
jgi:hypothetical protein